MANGNLIGVDLNIDHEYLTGVVRQVALAGIAEALGGKNEIVEAIVGQVMKQKVDPTDGKPDKYGYSGSVTLLEYYVRQMVTDEVKEQVKAIIDERRPEIRAGVREALRKKATVDAFTDAFCESVGDNLKNRYYTPHIEITFEVEE